ncbi:MAG: DUF5615 family PIN-like protein [Chloroflexi bacterium]|nr:DUF5615 family PIN-like protein [Chloroflexota bacterium]
MRLLLDSHVATAVAQQLRDRGVDALALAEWLDGNYRKADDEALLMMALLDRRVLVTYDLRTIPKFLKRLAEVGQHHGGVLLVHRNTIRPNDVGELVAALSELAAQRGGDDWQDRVMFLHSAAG